MLPTKAFCEALCIFLLISFASSASKSTAPHSYGDLKDADLRGLHVYSVSCREYNSENSLMPCSVLRESMYEKTETKFCDLQLKGPHVKKLQALSKDLVALIWYADYNSNYLLTTTVVNFTDCHSVEAKINRPLYLFDIVYDALRFATTFTTGHGKYHTLFDIPDACSAALCKMTFDAEGKQIRTSNFFKSAFGKTVTISDIKRLDLEKETYLVSEIRSRGRSLVLKYHLLTSNGTKFLIEFGSNAKYTDSVTHETIRFCQKAADEPGKVNCTAFDTIGEIISKETVKVDHEVVYGEVENLSDGGFLLFTDTKNYQHSYVTKVTAEGERVGTFELIGLPDCESGKCLITGDLKIVNNKYCRSVLRLINVSGKKSFNYGRKCFSDEDFN